VNIVQYFIDGEYLEYAGENSVMFDDMAGRGIAIARAGAGLSYPAAHRWT